VLTGPKGAYVYVVKEDMTVERRPIAAGIARDGVTVVEKGVSAGEKVVTEGQLRLVPGAKVRLPS
jgi:multidrug efflux system membrane fusion protein